MEKQISFSEGLVNTPYSDVSPDGQCSMLHNLEVHAGSVRPSVLLGSEIQLGGVLKFIHKTGEYTHYLYKDEDSESETFGYLMYKDSKSGNVGTVATAEQIDGLKDIAATGNVLTFLCNGKELTYGIWENKQYTFLGAIPDLNVSFALEGEEKIHTIDYGTAEPFSYVMNLRDKLHNENTDRDMYDYVLGAVNEFVSDKCNATNGGFVYPFFIRAAWKLYDGTYAKFGEPVLMIPNTKFPCVLLPKFHNPARQTQIDGKTVTLPYPATYIGINGTPVRQQDKSWQGFDVSTHNNRDDDEPMIWVDAHGYVIANVMRLKARIQDAVPEKWKTIIQGVEIMVSSPKPIIDVETEYTKPNEETGDEGTVLQLAVNEAYGKVNSEIEVDKFVPLNEDGEEEPGTDYDHPGADSPEKGEIRFVDGTHICYEQPLITKFKEVVVQDASYKKNTQSHSFNTKGLSFDIHNWNKSNARGWRDNSDYEDYYEQWTLPANFVTLQNFDEEKMKEKMDMGDFFHFKTIQAADIVPAEFVDLPLSEGQYDAIVTKTDNNYIDTWSKDVFYPKAMLEYNSRVNLYNLKIDHFIASHPWYALPWNNDNFGAVNVDVYVRIRRQGTTKIIQVNKYNGYVRRISSKYFENVYYLFVPNENAVGYIVAYKDTHNQDRYVEFPLQKSTSLYGAFYFNRNGTEVQFDENNPLVDYGFLITDEDIEVLTNQIYTSQVDNPFAYRSIGTNMVGSGEILKLATMTKPLSEGQMGGFPLIAFCSDGNYALPVIKEGINAGLYDAPTPMRPDVCINADSVAGIEEGIFFVSQRGLMLLTENDALLLTEKLDGPKDVDCKPELSAAETQEVSDLELEEEMPEPEEILVWLLRDRQIDQEMFFSNTEFTFEYLPGEAHHTFSLKQGQNYRLTIGGLWCDENDTVQLTIKLVKFENGIMSVIKTFTETVNHSDYIIENWEWEGEDVDDVEVYFGVSTEVVLPDNQKESPIGISVIHVVGRNEPIDDDSEEELPWIDPDTEPLVVEDGKEFDNLRAREYIEKCMPAWDYTNSRLLLVRRSYTDAYVMKADDKTWSTIELPEKVKKVINSYPFSYIQFEDNKVVVLDDDYNFSDTQHDNGVLVTRPIKMDSLMLKRVTEFAVQGNFEGKQRLTLWGSNDLKRWFKLGTTERRRVGAMRGYYFKYWRMSIETNLKENENISGVLVRYTIKDDGRFR